MTPCSSRRSASPAATIASRAALLRVGQSRAAPGARRPRRARARAAAPAGRSRRGRAPRGAAATRGRAPPTAEATRAAPPAAARAACRPGPGEPGARHERERLGPERLLRARARRRHHELQRAGERRDVLARHPRREVDEVGRQPLLLDPPRPHELLGRHVAVLGHRHHDARHVAAPERHDEQRPLPHLVAGHHVVERAAQRAGRRDGLDLGDQRARSSIQSRHSAGELGRDQQPGERLWSASPARNIAASSHRGPGGGRPRPRRRRPAHPPRRSAGRPRAGPAATKRLPNLLSPIFRFSLKQGTRGWTTWRRTVPIRQLLAHPAPLTSMPCVVRFSPNAPGPSSRPSSASHDRDLLERVGVDRLVRPAVHARSAWSSPSTLTPRTATRPATGSFQIAVRDLALAGQRRHRPGGADVDADERGSSSRSARRRSASARGRRPRAARRPCSCAPT